MIKHLLIDYEGEDVYACNHACSITKKKSTKNEEKVTCKNCLRVINSGNIYRQKIKLKYIED